MKYSLEADKYRSPYMPPTSLAMSMYSDPKYMDSSSKNYLERSYLDSSALTKAYFESSKMYMDGKYNPDSTRHYPLDISKMYSESSAPLTGVPSPKSSDSPDQKPNISERQDGSSSSSTTTSSAGASPGGLAGYYPASMMQQSGPLSSSLIPMAQYPGQYSTQGPTGEFRRPLTVIF